MRLMTNAEHAAQQHYESWGYRYWMTLGLWVMRANYVALALVPFVATQNRAAGVVLAVAAALWAELVLAPTARRRRER